MNLPDTELHPPHARSTHAVDILAFVEAQEIPSDYFETPYYLAPAPGGEKVYALLRETLRHSGKIGIAYVVIQSRQHLAAVVPQGQSLVLNTLRWSHEYESATSRRLQEESFDLATAQQMAMLAPTMHAGDYQNIFRPAGTDLEEKKMKAKKSERIIVEELEGLLDEDELIDDDYLASILGRRMHPSSGHALRQAQSPRRYKRVFARRRRG
ncbi:Ku protein [Noviherbaspirillum sp. ST9]|uniref:Ku protein n=1 Tax=Noviherbaspirillum sp. ST9 TaxID=3401606 RepID=UPI003B5862BF